MAAFRHAQGRACAQQNYFAATPESAAFRTVLIGVAFVLTLERQKAGHGRTTRNGSSNRAPANSCDHGCVQRECMVRPRGSAAGIDTDELSAPSLARQIGHRGPEAGDLRARA